MMVRNRQSLNRTWRVFCSDGKRTAYTGTKAQCIAKASMMSHWMARQNVSISYSAMIDRVRADDIPLGVI